MDCLWLKMIWLHLIALRFMLCILPQTGLISEREFSESSELTAANVFGIVNNGHSSQPVLFPLLSSGLPFLLLQYISKLFPSIITPYTLLLVPRFFMTITSLVVDILTYKISLKLYNSQEKAHYASLMFASSAISWIFCTRTFVATFQLVLVTTILFLIICKDYSHNQVLLISYLSSLATYVDVQSAGMVLLPLVFWLLRSRTTFVSKAISLLLGCTFTFAILTLIDCFFSTPEKLVDLYDTGIQQMSNLFIKLNFAPYDQFSKYIEVTAIDFQAAKLLLVLSPLYLFAFWKTFTQTHNGAISNLKWSVNMMWTLITANLLLVLLFTPHDYYVLLSLTVPLVVLGSFCLSHIKHVKLLCGSWMVLNIFTFLCFGMAYEGGMLPCIEYLHSIVKTHSQISNNSDINVLFYRTPLPPIHLINWPAKESTTRTTVSALQIQHSMETDLKLLEMHINRSLIYDNSIMYIIFPASIPCKTYMHLNSMYHLELFFEFFPHLTFIDPIWQHGNGCVEESRTFSKVLGLSSLKMYRITHLSRPTKHTIHYNIFSQ
uniref:Mannosyltransferase n=1 Tax=Phallusia mammillata TaxID=59560 RepID=A0A6F9DN44_9ASCI|nr:GPI mannosyltransferase 4-like [Phallusia mammillata]